MKCKWIFGNQSCVRTKLWRVTKCPEMYPGKGSWLSHTKNTGRWNYSALASRRDSIYFGFLCLNPSPFSLNVTINHSLFIISSFFIKREGLVNCDSTKDKLLFIYKFIFVFDRNSLLLNEFGLIILKKLVVIVTVYRKEIKFVAYIFF